MIFGQGAIRCHPYAYQEIKSLMNGDLKGFDRALWGHVGHVVRNFSRSFVLSLTRGYLTKSPVRGPAAKYIRKLNWASASFAFFADMAMGLYGGNLKRKGKLTGRFGDIFSWLYLATATLRRFEAEGRLKEDLPLLHWSMQYALARIQEAFDQMFRNMIFPFRGPIAWWSRLNPLGKPPSDKLGAQIAQILQIPGKQRDALTKGIYLPEDVDDAVGRLENAFKLVYEADSIFRKIRKAVRAKQLEKDKPENLISKAVDAGIISKEEADHLARAEEARNDAIQVDSFPLSEFPVPPQVEKEAETEIEEPVLN